MTAAAAGNKRAQRLNFFITFLSFIDTPLLVPVIALYAARLGAEVATIGLIVGVYSLTNTLASVIGGRLVDRFGHKWPLIAGLAGDSLAMFAYSLCRLPWHLGLVRALHGVGGGVVGPATMSVTARTSAVQRRGRGMAVYGMAIGMATLLGNATGGVIGARIGYEYVFYIGGSLLLLGFNLAVFLPNYRGNRPPGKRRLGQELRQTAGLLTSARLRLPYWSIFAQYFAFGGIVTLLPLRLNSLGLSSMHFGILLGTFAVVFIAILMLFGHLSDRVGRVKPAAAGLMMAALGVVFLPVAGSMPFMVALMGLFGFGYGLFFPSLSALVADIAPPEEYGRATGMYHALLTVGVAIGAPAMGAVASLVGTEPALSIASLPLFAAVVLAVGRLGRKS